MLMMSIPQDFKWTEKNIEELNKLSLEDKKHFLKRRNEYSPLLR
jgi:hypothetical protein